MRAMERLARDRRRRIEGLNGDSTVIEPTSPMVISQTAHGTKSTSLGRHGFVKESFAQVTLKFF